MHKTATSGETSFMGKRPDEKYVKIKSRSRYRKIVFKKNFNAIPREVRGNPWIYIPQTHIHVYVCLSLSASSLTYFPQIFSPTTFVVVVSSMVSHKCTATSMIFRGLGDARGGKSLTIELFYSAPPPPGSFPYLFI